MRFGKGKIIVSVLFVAGLMALSAPPAEAGDYLTSGHGNTTYGVSRPDMFTAGFSRGNCAHCHEQHASLGGTEPNPITGAQGYLLFDQNNVNQVTNFCFNCHGSGPAYQSGGHVINRSYSYRAGNYSADSLNNIRDAFSLASTHNLADIVTFAAGKAWKYTTDSNACGVCHDPHVIQGDPENSPNSPKSGASRTGVVTEINSSPVNRWGDTSGAERMNDFTLNYQPPLRIGGGYEPDGSATTDGSNAVDYVTFCTTCHNTVDTVYSSDKGRNIKAIDWGNEKHGLFNADDDIQMTPSPYTSGNTALGYVLSCVNCHEPHGSDNINLLRGAVNGSALSGSISTGVEFERLCRQCHNPDPLTSGTDWDDVHHSTAGGLDGPYSQAACNNAGCHIEAFAPVTRIDCSTCHYHRGISGFGGIPAADNAIPNNRETF